MHILKRNFRNNAYIHRNIWSTINCTKYSALIYTQNKSHWDVSFWWDCFGFYDPICLQSNWKHMFIICIHFVYVWFGWLHNEKMYFAMKLCGSYKMIYMCIHHLNNYNLRLFPLICTLSLLLSSSSSSSSKYHFYWSIFTNI